MGQELINMQHLKYMRVNKFNANPDPMLEAQL